MLSDVTYRFTYICEKFFDNKWQVSCVTFLLTYGGNNCADEIKRPGKIPARSEGVHPYTCHVRLLVMSQELLQITSVQVVLLAEELKPLSPSFLGLFLHWTLQCRKHSGSTQQVQDDEQHQHYKPGIIFIHGTKATAASAFTCHYLTAVGQDRK